MPNTTSAKKALRQSMRRQVQNNRRRAAYRNAIREVKKLITAAQTAEAEKLLPKIYKTLDKAAKTNAIKKNKASRLKSHVSRAIRRPEKQ